MPVNNDLSVRSTMQSGTMSFATAQPKGPGFLKRLLGVAATGLSFIPGVGGIAGGAINAFLNRGGGGGPDMGGMQSMLDQSMMNQMAMIQVQTRVQDQTQQFTTISNLLKARHDGEMSAVHNFKS